MSGSRLLAENGRGELTLHARWQRLQAAACLQRVRARPSRAHHPRSCMFCACVRPVYHVVVLPPAATSPTRVASGPRRLFFMSTR